ncbi:MAG TPA: dTDP-4-dehydrorhamnose reductase [Blastocatellia bacterium]
MGDGLSRKNITPSQPRRALITGAAGLLGRHMAARLSESLWQVTALARQQLDITREIDARAAVEKARPDVVINCAVTGDVDRCEREPDWAAAVNTEGPRLLARACRDLGIEIVHVSTDYVFDGAKEGFYTEQDEPRPLSVYGRSKLAGEAAVRSETDRSYIIRTSWIFGAGGRNFGSRVIEYARRGLDIKCVTDQTSITTYAPDLARRMEEIINRGQHGLYHVTSTGATSWYDFAREALALAGLGHIEIIPVARADLRQLAPRPRNTAMKSMILERLGLAPLRHWRDALPEFIKEGVMG